MKTGAKVRLIQPVIEGEIVERRVKPVTDELEAKVRWTENGEAVERWIDLDQLELAPAGEGASQ